MVSLVCMPKPLGIHPDLLYFFCLPFLWMTTFLGLRKWKHGSTAHPVISTMADFYCHFTLVVYIMPRPILSYIHPNMPGHCPLLQFGLNWLSELALKMNGATFGLYQDSRLVVLPFSFLLLYCQLADSIMPSQQMLLYPSLDSKPPTPVVLVKRFHRMEDLNAYDPLWTPRCFIAIPHSQHSILHLIEGNTIIINRIDYAGDHPFHPARILSVKTPAKHIGHSPSQLHKALLLEFGLGVGATLYIPFIWSTRPDQILRQLSDHTIIPNTDLLHMTSPDGNLLIFPKPFLAHLIPIGKIRSLTLLEFVSSLHSPTFCQQSPSGFRSSGQIPGRFRAES